MGRPRKQLKDLKATHGMTESVDHPGFNPSEPTQSTAAVQTKHPQSLNEILGVDGSASYKFLKDPFSAAEYENYVKSLSESQLYTHCQSFGLMYTDNRKQIERKLVSEFNLNRAKCKSTSYEIAGSQNQSPEKIKLLQDIMAKNGR